METASGFPFAGAPLSGRGGDRSQKAGGRERGAEAGYVKVRVAKPAACADNHNMSETRTPSDVSCPGGDTQFDLAEALVNPAACFVAPADVLTDSRISRQTKIEILCRWFYDATELSVAEEEGMGGGEPSKLGAVLSALHALMGGVDVERAGPTKHGAVCPASTTARG